MCFLDAGPSEEQGSTGARHQDQEQLLVHRQVPPNTSKILLSYMVLKFVGNTVVSSITTHPQGEMSEHEEVLPSGFPGHQALR